MDVDMDESCRTYQWVMSHVWMRRTYTWVMSHISMSHVSRMNASHLYMSHVAHINESCLTYECVALIHESCRTHEDIPIYIPCMDMHVDASCLFHNFIIQTWLSHMRDMKKNKKNKKNIHIHIHDAFNMTHPLAYDASCRTYGVATISRILKIIGLFCRI